MSQTPTPNQEINRRQFLESSAVTTAQVAAGVVGLSAVATAAASPQNRVSVAVIGINQQGQHLATLLANQADVDVVALCDVDSNLLPAAVSAVENVQGRAPRTVGDYRRLLDDPSIDAVVVATPDHWHASMAIAACQAGKDVYVETPVAHNIRESEQMLLAAQKHQRVVHTGMHQRSGDHFQSAVNFVRSGELGKVHLAKAWTTHARKGIGKKQTAAVPAGVDYEMWLGPAPKREFQPNRFHYNWHWFWDYGSGELGNWGLHMLDIARWGLNVELPERVSASGGKYFFKDDQETPDTLLVNYTFDDQTITWEHRLWSQRGIEGRNAAVAFYGDRGTLIVDRSGWKVYGNQKSKFVDQSESEQTHLRQFVNRVKERNISIASLYEGHLSTSLCHLGNIAHRMNREIVWNSTTNSFGSDANANTLLSREYRTNWELPVV